MARKALYSIQGGLLPPRDLRGKIGRSVKIRGWTESQSEINTMNAFTDGVTRTLLLPSGDSFRVITKSFQASEAVARVSRREYTLEVEEVLA